MQHPSDFLLVVGLRRLKDEADESVVDLFKDN